VLTLGTEPDQFYGTRNYGTGAHLNQTRTGTGTKIRIVVVVLLPFKYFL
jgi:hypothetical protein